MPVMFSSMVVCRKHMLRPDSNQCLDGTRRISDGSVAHLGSRRNSRNVDAEKGETDKAADLPTVAEGMDDFAEFSGNTTLHGLRYIGDPTSIWPRR